MVVVGGVCLQAGAAPASTPMVMVEGTFLQAATAPASTPAVALEDVGLQAATAAGSTPVDIVRARLADRGVNSSTHGHVASDAAIAEELKAQGGHIGRTVDRLLNRTAGASNYPLALAPK